MDRRRILARGYRAWVPLGAAGALVLAGAAAAQEVKRTELGRQPVSGDESREIVMQLVEIPPGATSRRHFHNGEEAFYVLEGGLAQMPGQPSKERPAGERGINRRGVPHAGYTVVGDRTVRILSVYVVDKGKPLQEAAD
ncbi:cupin domain-containing protein [Methylobacterium sp. J-026]|uniref:cupin domain-containing protein n=1 Tax=Methylobacterium sp. J-026 TaxID=2836624 RepID=UPI001FB9C3D9|nr:cupin domain-containing protein [Methylobacterium sp. J-026]MCJ2136569.1 cupin domain-containing protein [Methylobacterium sp. J-026]